MPQMSDAHAKRNNAIENQYGQIVKPDTLTSLLEVLGNSSWILGCCALEATIAFSKYGNGLNFSIGSDINYCDHGR